MANENYTVKAMINSKKALDTATIIEYIDNNNVIAEYGGFRCTAIYNPFVGLFYIDDIYGKIE
jgi:hypothetical protein